MFEKVNALLESESPALIENHEDVLIEAMTQVNDFQKTLKVFVLKNPEEFIGESVDDTYKNIRTFTEVSTAQYVKEITTLSSTLINEAAVIEEQNVDDIVNNDSETLREYL